MAAAAQKRTVKKATPKRAVPKTSAAGKPVAKRVTTKKTTTKKTTPKRRPTPKPSVPSSTAASTATAAGQVQSKPQRTGPVLGAYRLSLTAIEGVTVGVGGLALGSLGELGLPKKATGKLKSGHAGAIRGATKASDYVGTKVAKVIGKTVAVGSRTATWAFPE